MANLLGCSSCYHVKLPACFSHLLVTLEPFITYDAVFTNHFGKKKIIEVMTEADGSLQIEASDFPPGYFTSFNTVTLEFYMKSMGGSYGYYGSLQEGSDCSAVAVCGDHTCFTLGFYDTEDAVEVATVQCCDTGEECGCQQYIRVNTVGEFRSLIVSGKFNYLVVGGIVTLNDDEQNNDDGISYVPETLFDQVLNSLSDDTLLEDEIPFKAFYHFACDEDLMQQVALSPGKAGCGQCTVPQIVRTVGDVQQLADPAKQNFLHVIVFIPVLGKLDLAYLISTDGLFQVNPATSIPDLINETLPPGVEFFRFSVCEGIVMEREAAMRITQANANCSSEVQQLNLDVRYNSIPEGASIKVFALVGGEETAITSDVPVNGSDTIFFDYSDGQFPEGLSIDAGNNYFKVVITLPDSRILEDQEFIFVQECGKPDTTPAAPSLSIISAARVGCEDGPVVEINWEWAGVPAGSTVNEYLLSGGDETLFTDMQGAIEGTGSNTFTSTGGIDTGTNYVKIVVTLPNASTVEDTFYLEVDACVPSVEVNISQDACDFPDPFMAGTVNWTDIPAGSFLDFYMLSSGVETSWGRPPIAVSGTEAGYVIDWVMAVDPGANYVRAVITLPDTSIIENTINCTITECP